MREKFGKVGSDFGTNPANILETYLGVFHLIYFDIQYITNGDTYLNRHTIRPSPFNVKLQDEG